MPWVSPRLVGPLAHGQKLFQAVRLRRLPERRRRRLHVSVGPSVFDLIPCAGVIGHNRQLTKRFSPKYSSGQRRQAVRDELSDKKNAGWAALVWLHVTPNVHLPEVPRVQSNAGASVIRYRQPNQADVGVAASVVRNQAGRNQRPDCVGLYCPRANQQVGPSKGNRT